MITIEEGVTYQLKNHAGLTALINKRVYPIKFPQRCTMPCIVYQRIDTDRVETHDQAANGLAHARIQLSIWDDDISVCASIAIQVMAALEGFKGSFGSGATTVSVTRSLCQDQRSMDDPESGLTRIIMDWDFGHQE